LVCRDLLSAHPILRTRPRPSHKNFHIASARYQFSVITFFRFGFGFIASLTTFPTDL
jgi:hypothetical protein